ncbi:MAG: hypothetical protein IPL53_13125 [Ignavibacteria bacterium]|nr:hypothetical protein [Ignavibacteria bacterium]
MKNRKGYPMLILRVESDSLPRVFNNYTKVANIKLYFTNNALELLTIV